jgi:hypothetical protein
MLMLGIIAAISFFSIEKQRGALQCQPTGSLVERLRSRLQEVPDAGGGDGLKADYRSHCPAKLIKCLILVKKAS